MALKEISSFLVIAAHTEMFLDRSIRTIFLGASPTGASHNVSALNN
jgi:hypothetical protein